MNKSKQYVAKQYKINDENELKEQKQQIIEKKKINRQSTEVKKIECLSYKQRQKNSQRGENNRKKYVMQVNIW